MHSSWHRPGCDSRQLEAVEQLALLLVELALRQQAAVAQLRQPAQRRVELLGGEVVILRRWCRRSDSLLQDPPAADVELVLVLRVEQRLLEAVGVGQEADLARARLGCGQKVDLAVADDPPSQGGRRSCR